MTFTPTDYLPYDFANRRHIGPSPSEMDQMLDVVGAKDLAALIDDTLPTAIRQKAPLDFGKPKSERELLHHMKLTAQKNKVLTSLIGQGYHGTVTPPAIQRNILENPAWYTAYTPYQPEISQGRLEALLNFQTMVSDFTGLPVSNASLLDEATAAAEAMAMAKRAGKSKSNASSFFVDQNCHAQTIAVIKTRAKPLGVEVTVADPSELEPGAYFGAIFQYPGTYGHVRDYTAEIAAMHEHKGIAIVAADILALALLKATDGPQDLPAAAALLPQEADFDAVAYGCTSGTTLIGVDRVRALVQGAVKTRHVAQPLSATLAAFAALEVASIGLVSPYIDTVSGPMRQTFEAAGYAVPAMVSFGEEVEANVARIDPASIHAAALEVGSNPEVQVVFLSCTNLRTLDIIADLEQRLGKPVVSSNQALAWHMARLSGAPLAAAAPGVLVSKTLPQG